MLKLGSNTSYEKNFLSEKALSRCHELHGYMPAWSTYWIIEHADKMVKTAEQRNQKTKQLIWGRLKKFLQTFSKSHNFVTFIIYFFNSWKCERALG